MNTINGNVLLEWFGFLSLTLDYPKYFGSLVIRINSNDELELIKQSGEFFATDSWTRIPPN